MTLLLIMTITPPVQAALGLVEIGENDFQLNASGLSVSDLVLAYNQIENNYLVVWRLREASNHYEIYGQLFSVEGVLNQYLVAWRSNEGVSDTLEGASVSMH